ncbi:MAG: aminopeptidase P family protein [Clostridium sp.]|nr:aminopeptidase P family protein [Bacteroides sp.]MCM1197557.1 aminopeptidase P family protein [Clostridium sp.]
MQNIYASRISRLREMMASRGWDAVVICASDPHASEYPAPRWQQVKWISGFTGEAGDVVITMDHAGLWTDSRYFIQALEQLQGTGIELHRTRLPESVSIPQWLAGKASVVAVDGRCMSVDMVTEIQESIESPACCTVQDGCCRIVDVPDMLSVIWIDRPDVPVSPIITLDESIVGQSRLQKISWLRGFMLKGDYDAVLLSSLDEIAWLLNVRGNDIEYNPYVISYLYITIDRVCWFVVKDGMDAQDVDTEYSFNELRADGIEICRYDDIFVELMGEGDGSGRIFIDPSTMNANLHIYVTEAFGAENVVCGFSPVQLQKALKNSVEIQGFREAHLEDGLAMEKFLYWLEKEVASGTMLTEWDASAKLTSLRSEIAGYRGNSFENISAYAEHAALPHYSTPVHGSAVILPRGLYLVDSGGQYLFGTTDITRTVPMGECTPLEKEDYTLVLKGMIQLSMARFPKGTAGCQLDILARNALWRSKRNFGHGTGHGVGFYLGVHEGPQGIRQNFNSQPILPGMVTSNEPGIYREGMHGVRHENIILCVEAGMNDFGEWLEFETLTLCHIDTSAIVRELMTADEIKWLNAYNAKVYAALSPRLPSEISEWLRGKTQPL